MAKRKLLILTYHFPPAAGSGTFRMLGFAEHLPQFGWNGVVVAPPRLPWEPLDEALLERLPPETAVYRIPFPEGVLWKPMLKLFHERIWLPFAAAACYRAIRRHHPHAVLTSGPPHSIHLLGRHLRRSTSLPWVADFRDPWLAGYGSPPSGHARWERRAEPSVMRQADAIVANTPGACGLLCQAYPQYAVKMTSITNGYDPDVFEVNAVPPLSGSTIEIVHTGTIYANRSPGPFLDAIRQLELAPLAGKAFRVRFIGDFLDEQKKKAIQDNVHGGVNTSVSLEEQMPYRDAIRATVQADLLLLLDTPGRRAGVPAKLYEYIGAGRPILALAEPGGDVGWVLQQSGLPYRIAPPLDPEAIRRALTELLLDPATARNGRTPRPAHSRFTRRHLAGELAALLDSLREPSPLPLGERGLSEAAR